MFSCDLYNPLACFLVAGLEMAIHGNPAILFYIWISKLGQGTDNIHTQAVNVLIVLQKETQERIAAFPVSMFVPIEINILFDCSYDKYIIGRDRRFRKLLP